MHEPEETQPLVLTRKGRGLEEVEGDRAGLRALQTQNLKELLGADTDSTRRDIIGKEQAAEEVERDLERMSREHLLPDEKTLEKVARYETHLSRLFHKALHELEALQVRRTGGGAPLARLDVDGLAES